MLHWSLSLPRPETRLTWTCGLGMRQEIQQSPGVSIQCYIQCQHNNNLNTLPPPTPLSPASHPPTLTPQQLYAHLQRAPDEVLVLDCRPRADFLASHVDGKKYPQWLCVPEETVKKGWVFLPVCLLFTVFLLSISLSVGLSACLSVCLSITVCLSVC